LATTRRSVVDVAGSTAPWAPPRWASPAAVLLCVGGLGVSVYLTVAHYSAGITLACPDTGTISCEKVTTSPQSVTFGIPVAVLGVVFFAILLVLNVPAAWRRPYPLLRLTRLGLATSGVGFAVYLIYTELFTVHAICLWCTSAHVLAFLLFVVTLFAETLARPLGAQTRPRQQGASHVTQGRITP
jgi:uncharacterized membrane protein